MHSNQARSPEMLLLRSGDWLPWRLGEQLATKLYIHFRKTDDAFATFVAFSALCRPDPESDTIRPPLGISGPHLIDARNYELVSRADHSLTHFGLVAANMVYTPYARISSDVVVGWLREPFLNHKVLDLLFRNRYLPIGGGITKPGDNRR